MDLNKIYLGDCLDLMKDIPDKSIDLVLTDPPYGIDISKNGTVGVSVKAELKDYGADDWDSDIPKKEYFDEIKRISKTAIIFGGNYFVGHSLGESKCWIVWDKKIPKGYNKAQVELAWTNSKSYSRIYEVLWHGMIRDKGDSVQKQDKERYHPTQKPTKLFKLILEDFSKEGQTILDPFAGSGTTAIACHDLKRNFICIEKEPKYHEIACKRYNQHKAQLSLF